MRPVFLVCVWVCVHGEGGGGGAWGGGVFRYISEGKVWMSPTCKALPKNPLWLKLVTKSPVVQPKKSLRSQV